MKIAELFVTIGVTGNDKAVTALDGVTKGMKDAMSSALGFTAAITTAIYAFRKFGQESSQTGMDLKNFEAVNRASAETLQRWQQLSLNAGQSAESMTSSFNQLQSVMFKFLAGGQVPAGLARFQTEMTRLGKPVDTNRYQDPTYMMQKLREFALDSALTKAARMDVLSSFVSSSTATALMASQGFNIGRTLPGYSRKETTALAGIEAEWNKLVWTFEHSLGKLNAQYGPQLMKDLSGVSHAFLELVTALAQLNQVLPVFNLISRSIQGWAMAFGLIKDVVKGDVLTKDQMSSLAADLKPAVKESLFAGLKPSSVLSSILDVGAGSAGFSGVSHTKQDNRNYTTNFSITGSGSAQEIAQAVQEKLASHYNATHRQIQGASTGGGN